MAKMRACVDCGKPMDGMGTQCMECVGKVWWAQMLERQARAIPQVEKFELAPDAEAPLRRHIALVGMSRTGFCGAELKGSKKKWLLVARKDFPPSLCDVCQERFKKAERGEYQHVCEAAE